MPDAAEWIMPSHTRTAGDRMLKLLVVLGFGLMLGACSKCAVPNWLHSSAGTAPAACHDGPAPQ